MKTLILILISYITIHAQGFHTLGIIMGDAPVTGETVWVDTLIAYTFDANVTGLSPSDCTVEFQASQEGKTGVCKMTITATADAFFLFSAAAANGREIRLKYDLYIPAENTNNQVFHLNLGYQDLGYKTGTSGAWVTIDTTFTTAAELTQARFYAAYNNATSGLTSGNIWYFDNIRILGKAE